jgi:REP element-mobilizing transposase RayT
VTLRGVERRVIFTEDRERERFLERVADGVETHDVRVYLYCLMRNHAHLVLETPRANIDQFMHGLNTAYSVYFNLQHGRPGHLFQGRYGAVLVEGDDYLLRLTRYLHLNPVHTRKAGKLPTKERVRLLREYPWSSYRAYIGKTKKQDFVDYGPMLNMFPGKATRKRAAYRRFVERGIAKTDEEFMEMMRESPLAIGSEEFRGRIGELYEGLVESHRSKEDVSFRRVGKILAAKDVLRIVCEELGVDEAEARMRRRNSFVRSIAAKMLCKHAGLTQREVAAELEMRTGVAVCLQLKRFPAVVGQDRNLSRLARRIERRLAAELES